MFDRRLRRPEWLVLGLMAGCAAHAPGDANAGHDSARPPSVAQAAGTRGARPTHPDAAGFTRWVDAYRARARARGVAPAVLDDAFNQARFRPRVLARDRHQPEFNRAIWDYLDTAVSVTRVADGRAALAAHRRAARDAQRMYGVAPAILVAIWGMESDYGAHVGHYPVIDALATLGYGGRREAFATRQLDAALKILANGRLTRADLRGSWAGAMGNTQFLPTVFLRYAVDVDGDGQRDIWNSVPDTLASTAHYLSASGWHAGQPWGREVVLPAGFDYALADGTTRRTTAAWHADGVRPVAGQVLPAFGAAALIAPAGASGPAFLVGPNFDVIRHYNNSISYALGVALLADRIAHRPSVQQRWPRGKATLSSEQVRALQRDLNALGYPSGTPDGRVGPHTRAGVRAFQQAHGLTADGFPTGALFEKVETATRD